VTGRTDLTPGMVSTCLDCPKEVDGKRIEFRISDCDLEALNYSLLTSTDSKYLDSLRTFLLTLLHVIIRHQ
jgi:hypothetical protein